MAEAVLSSLYLISYEMHHPEDSLYDDFFQFLHAAGAVQLTRPSVWILRSEESMDSLFSKLKRLFPENGGPLLVLVVDSLAKGAFRAQGIDSEIELLERL